MFIGVTLLGAAVFAARDDPARWQQVFVIGVGALQALLFGAVGASAWRSEQDALGPLAKAGALTLAAVMLTISLIMVVRGFDFLSA